MTADAASPDTPTDPRAWQKDAEKIAIEIAGKVAERLRGEEDDVRVIAMSVAGAVFGALRRAGYLRALDAGLLSLSGDSTQDEGSLRSEASGTPMETGEVPKP